MLLLTTKDSLHSFWTVIQNVSQQLLQLGSRKYIYNEYPGHCFSLKMQDIIMRSTFLSQFSRAGHDGDVEILMKALPGRSPTELSRTRAIQCHGALSLFEVLFTRHVSEICPSIWPLLVFSLHVGEGITWRLVTSVSVLEYCYSYLVDEQSMLTIWNDGTISSHHFEEGK